LNIAVSFASTAEELFAADRIILPGVGAFDRAMARLRQSGLTEALEEAVIVRGKPILGICVGMQMLASSSDEGILPGLGWIDAVVKRLGHDSCAQSSAPILPHMGWNDVNPLKDGGLFRDLGHDARFYFLHSYYFSPRDEHDVLAVTDYHGWYASSVGSSNIFGVQFHPEKSHYWGIQLLKNFSEI
jgi:glutamine amidotransferase